MKEISLIIPTYNEEENIQTLVKRLNTVFYIFDITYELIFIDDHSTDKTREKIQELQWRYPISLHLKKGKKGKAWSIIEGFSYAKYKLLGMIDADLQYPPEALPVMIKKITDDSVDIIVANRDEKQIEFKRRILSRMFAWFFGKFLHGLNYDVQSGLKIFKKEIIQRIFLRPTAWTFDLEFLIKAKNAGYKIDTVDIVFEKRKYGKSKVSLLKASFEIGLMALKVKFQRPEIIPLLREEEQGFHYKGEKFISYTDLHHTKTAFYRLTSTQLLFLVSVISLLISGLVIDWHSTLIIAVGFITFLYFIDMLFNLFLIFRTFTRGSEVKVTEKEITKTERKDWPLYTIFCPLYREWKVLPQFIAAINSMDYPKEKLQVLLLLEEDDKRTIEEVEKIKLPSYMEIKIVPNSFPKTKPKALNYGLNFARGDYVVVYDAEDMPDVKQLKKAVLGFSKVDKKTICLQGKLNFYNTNQNILTRMFTAEYSLWFDLILTGLHSLKAPIPLGGTSNHFRTKDLRLLQGWDAFNVTEDCDLGIRLAKEGYKTAMLDSTTLEEANSSTKNWFWQRSRWIKGYMQTYLVHMRNPKSFIYSWPRTYLLAFQLIVGGKIFSMFINPFMWIITLTYFVLRPVLGGFIESFFPGPILYMGVFSLIFGNFLYLYYYMIGCVRNEQYELVKYAFLTPFYWVGMSAAAWIALYSILIKPHYWSKTLHGLHLNNEKFRRELNFKLAGRLDNGGIFYPTN